MTKSSNGRYDLILVGSGFASSMFLDEYLRHAGPRARILVLERGTIESHRWQLAHRHELHHRHESSFVNRSSKRWVFRLAFGGASNCWWACVPRMLPEDFELETRYGVGQDWPLGYDELEEYYCLAEEIMTVSGSSDDSPFPRSRPYPQAPHKLSTTDEVLKKAYPEHFFVQPAARPRQTTATGRLGCCANGVCDLCPIDSKFTIQNGLRQIYDDPRVELQLAAEVEAVDVAGGQAQGAHYRQNGTEHFARAEVIGLGANAIFNPYLLMRSGLEGPAVGEGLVEQASVFVDVDLDGLDNHFGSTVITGHGYMFYSGPHRKRQAAGLVETWNSMSLRDERGRWLQRMRLKVIFEDLRQAHNQVLPAEGNDLRPRSRFKGRSGYTVAAIQDLSQRINGVLSPLPVEDIRVHPMNETEAHILGTAMMGHDPETSVVDRDLIHHRVRNLLVLGGSAFPTAAPANPTLTICALSLRAAREMFSS